MDPIEYAQNKLNSLLSTGPKSVEGKRRSSLNATRHSLTGQIVIFSPEEGAAYEKHCADLVESMAPHGIQERELAQSIAEDRWRLKRARALENSIFAQGYRDHVDEVDFGHEEVNFAVAQGNTWKEQAKNLHLLTIYEQRINRAIEKNTAQLKELQAARKAAYQQAQAEALLLTELAESKGQTYDPAPDFPNPEDHGGFVYASREITRLLGRQARLKEALGRHEPPAARSQKRVPLM